MDEQIAVVVGAALGAGGGLLGAIVGLAGARAQARAQVEVARLQATSQRQSELLTKRREAYRELGLAVDAVRRQLGEMALLNHRRPQNSEQDRELERDREEASAIRDRLLTAAQEAEWRVRLMLTREEQPVVSVLVRAMDEAADRAANWRFTIWETGDTSGDTLDAEEAFTRAQAELREQLMEYAHRVQGRLAIEPVPVVRRRWLRRRTAIR